AGRPELPCCAKRLSLSRCWQRSRPGLRSRRAINEYTKYRGDFQDEFYEKQGNGKAHIRYIQHRPGRTADHAAHHRRGFFCCGQFAENCDILGMSPSLALALSPDYTQYHSRFCETHTSYYRLQGYSREVEKLAHQDNGLA